MNPNRPEGRHLSAIHPYRSLMLHVMPTRDESVVYFDLQIIADDLLHYLKQQNAPVTLHHALLSATAKTLHAVPAMNRFVSGGRLYERTQPSLTFSMKRKKLDAGAKLATVNLPVYPNDTLQTIYERTQASVDIERSDRQTYADREFNILTRLPSPLLQAAVNCAKILDRVNLLPASFIANDPLYCSAFIANLGSLGMDPGYHHLFEWGNCPIFIVAGQLKTVSISQESGPPLSQQILPLRISYDERIDDGLTAKQALESLREFLEKPGKHSL